MTQIYSQTPNPRVSSAYYQTLLDFLRQSVGDEVLLKQQVDLVSLPTGSLPMERYLTLVDIANDNLAKSWGIDLGLMFRPATYGLLGLLPLHCDNLLEALNMVLKFESLVHDLGTSSVGRRKQSLVFNWHANFYNSAQMTPVAHSVLSGMQQFSSWLSGSPIVFSHLILPCDCQHPWLESLNLKYEIKPGKLEFQVSIEALKKPIAQADVEIKQALLNSAQIMMSKKQPEFIKKLLAWFDSRITECECTLEQAATLLDISPRTLQRHLQQQGLNYQLLLLNFRKNKALNLLRNTNKSILQVAGELGFKEQSSFSNAFKIWFGQAPMSFIKGNTAAGN